MVDCRINDHRQENNAPQPNPNQAAPGRSIQLHTAENIGNQ